jgi:hypothetical protein
VPWSESRPPVTSTILEYFPVCDTDNFRFPGIPHKEHVVDKSSALVKVQ